MTKRRGILLLGMGALLAVFVPACGTKKNDLILDPDADLSLTNRAGVAAVGSDDELLRHEFTAIYNMIRAGDAALDAKNYTSAGEQYVQAFQRLSLLHKTHPQWEQEVIEYRLDYCRDRLTAIAARGTQRSGE